MSAQPNPGDNVCMKTSRLLAWPVLAFATLAAHAQYKCQVDGKTVFQQMPCAGGPGSGHKLDVRPASGTAPASEPVRRDWAAELRSSPARRISAPPSDSTAHCPSPQRLRDMEFEASKIDNRYNESMQAELARAKGCR